MILERLAFIRHAQAAGLTLERIRQVPDIRDGGQPPCVHVAGLIALRLGEVGARLARAISAPKGGGGAGGGKAADHRCSFCGKPRTGELRLIAGPGVWICADCVNLCSEILAEDPAAPPAQR